MADLKPDWLDKISGIEKRLSDLESYVYNLDDFLPARSLIEKAINFMRKKDKVSVSDLEKRFRITNIRAQKLIELFIDYAMLSKEADTGGYRKVNKEAFGIYELPIIEVGYKDSMLPQVIECVKSYDYASASLLQRKFKIGYARAAKILDLLEVKGLVGPAIGSKPREVLKKSA